MALDIIMVGKMRQVRQNVKWKDIVSGAQEAVPRLEGGVWAVNGPDKAWRGGNTLRCGGDGGRLILYL